MKQFFICMFILTTALEVLPSAAQLQRLRQTAQYARRAFSGPASHLSDQDRHRLFREALKRSATNTDYFAGLIHDAPHLAEIIRYHETLAHLAARHASVPALTVLFNKTNPPAKPNVTNQKHETPLMVLTKNHDQFGEERIVTAAEILLAAGANTEIVDYKGRRPLDWLARQKATRAQTALMQLLLLEQPEQQAVNAAQKRDEILALVHPNPFWGI